MEKISIELLLQENDLRAIENEWRGFLSAVPPPTPFQTPEWLLTWWSHFGSGKLHTLLFRLDGELVGVFPGFLHEWNGRRQITLIGSGISDYTDPVFDPRHSSWIVTGLQEHITRFPEWDRCDWQDLSDNTPLAALGSSTADTSCSQVLLTGSFETFLAARPKDLRRNLRRYKEKAEATGPVNFEVTRTADPHLLETLIDLHGARWRKSGEPGMVESNGSAAFLREVAAVMACRDLLRIFTVRFGGEVAAILLAFRNENTIFSYLSAFDPEYERFGFGRELLARSFEYAYREGYEAWNFLRGEESYKFSWGAQIVPKRRVCFDR